ncbi:MAG: hypothetical protein GX605_01240 [Chloroflexi bacterium]|nr:hypothetical protein [Chloroflexota bacterium]
MSGPSLKPLVHLNTATQQQLESLPGIGKVRARAIVQHRQEHGAFAHIEELQSISAIPESVYQEIVSLVTVQPLLAETPAPPWSDETHGEGATEASPWPSVDRLEPQWEESAATPFEEAEPETAPPAEELTTEAAGEPARPAQEELAEAAVDAVPSRFTAMPATPQEPPAESPTAEAPAREATAPSAVKAPPQAPPGKPLQADKPTPAPQRRSGPRGLLWVALGALLGAGLSLLILYVVNGTLSVARHPDMVYAKVMVNQLESGGAALREMMSINEQQLRGLQSDVTRLPQMQNDLAVLSQKTGELLTETEAQQQRVSKLLTDHAALQEEQEALKQENAALQSQAQALATQLERLSRSVDDVQGRMVEVEKVSERMVLFLTGLQDLLQKTLSPLVEE